ncbi:37693_t:CDS:2 [Gigaspora margarita]|uniref:37693_t:CDS:1 n=1 Tax=Gigaspora margarita TaxID=4874 RepID=A0ABN7UX49_GIGMA|nr:37693_t:CDS:2 [Gigaspora margarita]
MIIIEEPSIEYSYRKLDPLLPPAFRLQVQGNKTLFQCKYTYKKNNFIGGGDCTAYLKIRETYTSTTEINGTIYTNGNVTSYEFVPSNLINITTLFITWYTNGSNEDFISFGQANYPNQIALMNFVNYFLADKILFIKENTYFQFQSTHCVFDNTVDNVVANNHTTILISPYGKVQGDPDMQILETVETEKRLPLFEEKNDTSQKEYINYLISRLHSLETILEEYGINSDFIEKLDK